MFCFSMHNAEYILNVHRITDKKIAEYRISESNGRKKIKFKCIEESNLKILDLYKKKRGKC